MVDQTIINPIRFIKDLKIHIPRIPYIATFTIMKNNVLNPNYSMLNRPWLCNACIIHDWGNNLITIEGNGIVQTIAVTTHLGSNTKRHQVLMCYDLMEGITYEEEEIFFIIKPNLFTLWTITLLEQKILNATIFGVVIRTKDPTFNFPHLKG